MQSLKATTCSLIIISSLVSKLVFHDIYKFVLSIFFQSKLKFHRWNSDVSSMIYFSFFSISYLVFLAMLSSSFFLVIRLFWFISCYCIFIKKNISTLAWVNYLREQKLEMKFISWASPICATQGTMLV
jgi:hypothetical protein